MFLLWKAKGKTSYQSMNSTTAGHNGEFSKTSGEAMSSSHITVMSVMIMVPFSPSQLHIQLVRQLSAIFFYHFKYKSTSPEKEETQFLGIVFMSLKVNDCYLQPYLFGAHV